MILELTSKKTLSASTGRAPVNLLKPRLSPNAIAYIDAIAEAEDELKDSGASLSPISVNRAVSSATLAKLDDFYVNGMGAKKVSDHSANGVSRKCYLWSGATVDVCFTSRADSATKGDFKVADFENMLNTVHKNIIVGHPYCQVDKWEDNHYAIDSFSALLHPSFLTSTATTFRMCANLAAADLECLGCTTFSTQQVGESKPT